MFRKKTKNYLALIIAGLTLILLSLVALAAVWGRQLANQTSQNPSAEEKLDKNLITLIKNELLHEPQLRGDSPVLGDKQAPLTLFEYASFGCAYGAQIQAELKNLLAEYGDQIKLVWKDLPMEENYKNITQAHQAARCAQEQGQFWSYQELIWANQRDLSSDNLKQLASQLKLNRKKFDACLGQQDFPGLAADLQEADDLMIPGTPYFYLNGQELIGYVSQEQLEKFIQQAIANHAQ